MRRVFASLVVLACTTTLASAFKPINDMARFDVNNNGQIDPAECDALASAAELDLCIDYETVRNGRSGVPIAEAIEEWGAKENSAIDWPIKLRKSFKEVTVLTDINKLLDNEPANFSYLHDFETTNDIWSANGAFIFPFRIANTEEGASFKNFILQTVAGALGLSFDKVSNEKNKAKEVDALGFHSSIQFEFGGGGLFEKQYLTFEGTLTSDSKAKTEIVSVDADWQPIIAPLAINSINYFNEHIGYRTKAIARFRNGSVLDTGDNPALKKDEFSRLGGNLGFDLYFGEFYGTGHWLQAGVDWQFYEELSGPEDFSDLVDANINFYPGANQNISLTARYRNGDVPLVKNRIEQLTIGLGIKF